MMRFVKVCGFVCVIAFLTAPCRAGMYQWAATPEVKSITGAVGLDSSGSVVYGSLPVGPGYLLLDYQKQYDGYVVQTTNDSTYYYGSSYYSFFLSVGPGFIGEANSNSIWDVKVSTPASGLDSITFNGKYNTRTPGFGYVEIFAPHGTLTSQDLPDDLTAFEAYGANHLGGSFAFTPGDGWDFPFYATSYVCGTLGAVPEPSSFVLLATAAIALIWRAMR